MGLDMYLYAKRNLPEDFEPGVEARKEFAVEGEAFVADYDFYPAEQRARYRTAVDAAGLTGAVDPDSPSAEIVSDEDNERDGFALRAIVAYWRKANAIHKWFVEECQGGVDECQMSDPISREKLTELRDLAQAVLGASKGEDGLVTNGWTTVDADPEVDLGHGPGMRPILVEGQMIIDNSVAKTRLPTQAGFFFGGTDYDEYYLGNLKDTVEQIDRVLRETPEDATFHYRSSW
jgi:hypothetical protein